MMVGVKILLPDTIRLHPRLPEGWQAVRVDASVPIPDEHHDAEVLVLWGPSEDHLTSAVCSLTRLRFVQTLSAGVESVLDAGFNRDVILANGSGLHDLTVAEHTIAVLLSLVRDLPAALQCQGRHEWSEQLGGIRELQPSGKITTLLDTRTLIWGFGRIAQALAPILHSLGSSVTGVARHSGERAGFPVISNQSAMDELAHTDVLISVLPATSETRGILGAEVFAALPSRAVVVNVGRGSVVDQQALIKALETHEIAAAALDVTTPEPLPPDHPLWNAPGLILTPHAAGGRPVGATELVERNLQAVANGRPIENRVND